MSNFIDYKELAAFHPGFYVAEIIEDMGITQSEFASRLGTSTKTLSELVNGQTGITKDLAKKLSAMLGISAGFWLNAQKTYDEKVIEIERRKDMEGQIGIINLIDYAYFVKNVNLKPTRNVSEKISILCEYFNIFSLKQLCSPDFLVNFRTAVLATEKNIINSQAWLQTALNCARNIETSEFNAAKLRSYLPEIRSMTLQCPDVFLPRLKKIFSECGVVFVLLPHLKNSGINGAVKWLTSTRVLLAMNDRRAYADTFWFSLFHEIKHVLQQKVKSTFITASISEWNIYNKKLEDEADTFARDYLIPKSEYNSFVLNNNFTKSDIINFAKSIEIHPGIVVGRLQYDKKIPMNRFTDLKTRYIIVH